MDINKLFETNKEILFGDRSDFDAFVRSCKVEAVRTLKNAVEQGIDYLPRVLVADRNVQIARTDGANFKLVSYTLSEEFLGMTRKQRILYLSSIGPEMSVTDPTMLPSNIAIFFKAAKKGKDVGLLFVNDVQGRWPTMCCSLDLSGDLVVENFETTELTKPNYMLESYYCGMVKACKVSFIQTFGLILNNQLEELVSLRLKSLEQPE